MGLFCTDGRRCRSNGPPKLIGKGWATALPAATPHVMTNTIALWLGGIIAALFIFDGLVFDWAATIIVMQKLIDLIDYLAIWR